MKITPSQPADLLDFLSDDPDLLLAIVFGSIANGCQRPDSDIDVAVYPRTKLQGCKRQLLVDEIAIATGRAVDLIDLSHVDGSLLRQILRTGKVIFSKEPGLLGTLSERLLDWQEDFEPQLNALLETRLQHFTSPLHGS